MPSNWTIESLIAWIIYPIDGKKWDGLPELADFSGYTFEKLAEQLRDDNFKTRWDIHEHIIAYVTVNPNAADKARKFFRDMPEITDGSLLKSDNWKNIKSRSDDNCAVWQFQF